MARKAAIVGLILLIVLVAIPIGIGMAMAGCPDCSAIGTSHALGLCLTLEAMAALLVPLALVRMGDPSPPRRALLLSRTIERPPRTV